MTNLKAQKYDIFISYRRASGSECAELIRLMLERKGYSSKKIFMDTHTLGANDVKPHLQEAIEKSNNFVLLITKGCFDRIKDNDLWIFEIQEAIRRQKNIIPVFFDGIKSFEDLDLPLEIESIKDKNGVIYSHEYSDACYDRICSMITDNHGVSNNYLYLTVIALLSILVLVAFVVIIPLLKSKKNEPLDDTNVHLSLNKDTFKSNVNKNYAIEPSNLGTNNAVTNIHDINRNDSLFKIEILASKKIGCKHYYFNHLDFPKVVNFNNHYGKKIISLAQEEVNVEDVNELVKTIKISVRNNRKNDSIFVFESGAYINLLEILENNDL